MLQDHLSFPKAHLRIHHPKAFRGDRAVRSAGRISDTTSLRFSTGHWALGNGGDCWRIPPEIARFDDEKPARKSTEWGKTMLLYASFFENLDAENHLLSFHTVRGHFRNFERTFLGAFEANK